MSSNRLIYDQCEYKTQLQQNIGTLEYTLNPMKYENCNKCRMQLGIVGGTDVSKIRGNLVDLETDLRGQTRPLTQPGQCPSQLWKPQQGRFLTIQGRDPCSKKRVIDTQLVHLRPCQMFTLNSVPAPVWNPQSQCSQQKSSNYNCKTC